MRKKIKQLMNKEEGFTLVELLAVIVILGLIIAIAVPAIGSIMDDAEKNTEAATITLIEDAARLYDVENDFSAVGTDAGIAALSPYVKVDTLINSGFLDLRDNEDISDEYVEKVPTTTGTGFTYESSIVPTP